MYRQSHTETEIFLERATLQASVISVTSVCGARSTLDLHRQFIPVKLRFFRSTARKGIQSMPMFRGVARNASAWPFSMRSRQKHASLPVKNTFCNLVCEIVTRSKSSNGGQGPVYDNSCNRHLLSMSTSSTEDPEEAFDACSSIRWRFGFGSRNRSLNVFTDSALCFAKIATLCKFTDDIPMRENIELAKTDSV